MRLLTFSTLYPNAEQPNHGIFVETRLRHLLASGHIESRVVAPVPWFPLQHPACGRYASYAKVPSTETRFGIPIIHPRYPLIPKIGMSAAPFLLAHAVKPVLQKLIDEGYDFDLIDAHYFYPDGVAAAILARHFNKPVVITARGSDINLLAQYRLPRKLIVWAAHQADGIITVCNALKHELVKLGVSEQHITTLRNGVALQRFYPGNREQLRNTLWLEKFTLLSAGNLVPEKGHDLVIKALPALADAHLVIAGGGAQRQNLETLAQQLNVADRVRFLGVLPQDQLIDYYRAVDALVLASSREGWANVLLESMACGTPVVASNVSGTPEVVASPEAGVLIDERTPEGIARGVRALRAGYPSHMATRSYAERFSWDDTTVGQLRLFQRILRTQLPEETLQPQRTIR